MTDCTTRDDVLYIAIKQLTLSTTATASTLILLVLLTKLAGLNQLCGAADAVVTAMALLMMFKWYERFYKVVCKPCHQAAHACCGYLIAPKRSKKSVGSTADLPSEDRTAAASCAEI